MVIVERQRSTSPSVTREYANKMPSSATSNPAMEFARMSVIRLRMVDLFNLLFYIHAVYYH